ncbi:GNAT family N-acetyltransferase [uncultured Mitsuokella sp.]|uniref:GNAT family N-acetyltransferase n=1 Tax=uncultured Mitsuokella sp. TaxID=453120 RepID=UPI002620EE12|nr:GNAT family N-acetyltransferase [uncultured Mitsuokella sp.]
MGNEIEIRVATPDDAEALLAVYAPYVTDTAISFECEVPTIEEFRRRIAHTLQRYPYLVALRDGAIAGYAYAGPFVGRAAYDWSVETSIYVARHARRAGLGRALYTALENILREMGVLNLNACIGYPKKEDEYLTTNSVDYHRHLGYAWVGRFHDSGCKFGRWYDMVWMEKIIGNHPENPEPIRSFPEVRAIIRECYGIA